MTKPTGMVRQRGLWLVVLLALFAPPGAASGRASDAADGWFVVAYGRPITSEDRAALDAAGARAVSYLPEHSYVVFLDEAARARLGPSFPIRRIRPLRPEEKVVEGLTPAGPVGVVSFGKPVRGPGLIGVRAADPAGELIEEVVRTDAAGIRALAARPEVLSVGPASERLVAYDETTSQIVAGNVSGTTVEPGYRAFLDSLGLDGSGVTIAIADSGIYDNHPDLAGRVAARRDFTPLPDHKDSDGHGTHVSGIAAGGGVLAPYGNDPNGFTYGLGVAPGATLVDAGVLGIIEEIALIDEFPPFEEVSRFASRAGAIGWNASWGSGEGPKAGYVTSARTMDLIARDADWETPGAQPFILVFAAGNDGTAGMGAPNEAKNIISVASSRSSRAGSIDTISSFSSRGPTRDGRIGPTVAAPGEIVVSTRGLPATVLCNTPPREAAPLVGLYATCSGTSMAAPHVTGAVAVLTQWWRRDHGGATPSPAMVKALLVNSATDMLTPDIPNRNEGWGRVNLRTLLDPAAARVTIDGSVVLGEVGEYHGLKVAPADPGRPMKVSLAWMDAPAVPNAAIALVNDLDLTITGPGGEIYLGNRFSGGTSVLGGSPDRREVNENVFLASPGGGTYTVRVSAANLPGDGVPFAGDATDQDFALVLTNAILVE